VHLGKNRIAWLENEIDGWINALASAPREHKSVPPAPRPGRQVGRPRKTDRQLAQPAAEAV